MNNMCDFRPRMTKMHRLDLDRPPNVNVRPHVQGLLKNVEDLDQKVHQIDETIGIAGKNFNFFQRFFFTENVFFVKIETRLFIFKHKNAFFFKISKGPRKEERNLSTIYVGKMSQVSRTLSLFSRC